MKSGDFYENGRSSENSKLANWIWQIFKFHGKRGPLVSGAFGENSESGKNSQNLPMVWRYIKISCKKGSRDEKRNREWKIRVNNIRQKKVREE